MPDPIRKGNLSDHSFARVYYILAGQNRTGVLDIVDEADSLLRKRIYFLGGDSNFVNFGPLNESLGQILLHQNIINEDQLEEAIDEIAISQKQIGRVLVEREWISPEKLHETLVDQTRSKIISCFAYTDGQFKFSEESVTEFKHDVSMYKINPDWIVYQGVTQHYSLDRLEKEFEYLKDKGLRHASDFEERIDVFQLLPEEADFIRSISEGKAFGHVIGGSDLGLTRTLKVLYSLLVTQMVEISEVKSIKSVKIKERETVRRKPKTLELEDVSDVKAEIRKAAMEAGCEEDLFVDDTEADFSSVVSDYLTEQIEKEEGPGEKSTGDLIKFEEADKQMIAGNVSEILISNKKDAMEAYLSKRGTEGSSKIGELFVQNKVIDSNQLQAAFANMRDNNTSFLNSLVDTGAVANEDLHDFLSDHFKVPAVNLSDLELDQEIVSLLPEDISVKYKAIPINRTGRTLVLAMSDPSNIEAVDEIKFLTEFNIEVVVATEKDIKEAIDKFHDSADMLDDVMAGFDDSDIETATFDDDDDLFSIEKDSETAPVVKLVNQVLVDALHKGASDVHFEPYEGVFRIRYRIDGVLYQVLTPPFKLRTALVSRIKIMAGLDIAERRLPQDGRISLKIGKKKIDFRVSTLPTLWGEKLVLRILDKESLELDLTKLGMEEKQLEDLRWALYQPYGMVLVTGPSGCGKTTTLYSSLLELNKVSENISTAEDPIEYYLEGINQVQMREEVGLNFAFTLRSFLRQDPDIIMVGEIRDFETAEISVKAALTGHIVLSTVHTNDAPSTINRLLNMGVEPFLISASVNGVASQRLVRKLCDECKEPEKFDRSHLLGVGVAEDKVDSFKPYQAVGCSNCSDRGFKGRLGIYEVMPVRGDLAEFILAGATPNELKKEAMRRGMLTMRQAGLNHVNNGLTTLSEITRTTMPDFLGAPIDFDDV